MNPISQYRFPPGKNEPAAFGRGFALAVIIILLFAAIIIGGLVASFWKTTDAANAKLVYLAAQTKALEFAAADYRVPVQADLLELIGTEANQDAVIQVVDENRDAVIDYIVYQRNGLVTSYAPGAMAVTKDK